MACGRKTILYKCSKNTLFSLPLLQCQISLKSIDNYTAHLSITKNLQNLFLSLTLLTEETYFKMIRYDKKIASCI